MAGASLAGVLREDAMNKYLMLTAAALLGSATTVDAKTYCFTFATAGEQGCDGGRLYTGLDGGALNGAVQAWIHADNNCAGATSQGYGFLSKTVGLGKVSLMSDDFFARNYGIYNEALTYVLPKKIENGAPWRLWAGLNGTSAFKAGSGFLVNVGNCQNRAAHHGGKSTLDGLRELIRLHRNAKARPEPNE
jgi:hypothetical protein